jgi:DNA modification methylase
MTDRKLTDIFIVPPISVLDVKQKYWKDRRKQWLELGIQSELGRNENLLKLSELMSRKQKSTSVFDPVLCEIMYTWFTNTDDSILDPFCGGSVRGIVASHLKRNYVGIDIRKEQLLHNEQQTKELCSSHIPQWIEADGITKELTDEFDFLFTCPPYYDLERYSDQKYDLSTMQKELFEVHYENILNYHLFNLKQDRFSAIVVGDVRDKNGFYLKFPAKTVEIFERAGLKFYNNLVLLQEPATAAMRSFNYMNSSRKIAKCHQNVLIFVKGDPIKATERLSKFKDTTENNSFDNLFITL